MKWMHHQQVRLAQENQVLATELPWFQFYDPAGDAYVAGRWWSSARNQYEIRIEVPRGYPDECPLTYVSYPSPLRGYWKPIEEYGASQSMHTLQTLHPGWVRVCTMRPERWRPTYSLEKLARKAMLWLEAYECHMDEGRPIAEFLAEERETDRPYVRGDW
jgi:hypothetical protein